MAEANEAKKVTLAPEMKGIAQVTDNSRGIPEAIFIENVEDHCKTLEATVAVGHLQDLYSKYQYMQSSMAAQRGGLKAKLPDITAALETVKHLIDRREKADEEREYTYQLCETIYSKAIVPPTDNVCLWLGANVMLEYTLEEAEELLTKNQENAKTTLVKLEDDSAYLRDQMTTTEVNIARTHNHGVKIRAQQRQEAGEGQQAQQQSTSASAPKLAEAAKPCPSMGSGAGFTWKQESDDIEISVAVEKGSDKSDVKVTIHPEKLRVELKGKVLLEGELFAKCSPDSCTWTLAGDFIEISLAKVVSGGWQSLFASSD